MIRICKVVANINQTKSTKIETNLYNVFLCSGTISMTVQSQRRKFPDLVEMRQAITPLLIFYSTKGQVIYIKIPRVLAYYQMYHMCFIFLMALMF